MADRCCWKKKTPTQEASHTRTAAVTVHVYRLYDYVQDLLYVVSLDDGRHLMHYAGQFPPDPQFLWVLRFGAGCIILITLAGLRRVLLVSLTPSSELDFFLSAGLYRQKTRQPVFNLSIHPSVLAQKIST